LELILTTPNNNKKNYSTVLQRPLFREKKSAHKNPDVTVAHSQHMSFPPSPKNNRIGEIQ
jgi:hypothetical protein